MKELHAAQMSIYHFPTYTTVCGETHYLTTGTQTGRYANSVPCNEWAGREYSTMKLIYRTVSAKIAPRLKCYKNASRLNRYNFPTDNAIDFLFSTLHTTPFQYEGLKIGSR